MADVKYITPSNDLAQSVGKSDKRFETVFAQSISDGSTTLNINTVRSITFGTEEYVEGVTDLATNHIYLQFE